MNQTLAFPSNVERAVAVAVDREPWWPWLLAVPFGIAMTLLLALPVAALFEHWPTYVQLVLH